MKGSIPSISEGLEEVTAFTVSTNELTSLGSLSSLTGLETLDVSGNQLQFGSLEGVVGMANTVTYAPQNAVLEETETLQEVGANYTVDRTVSGSNNVYNWFKDDVAITNTGGTLEVAIASFADEGVFYAEVTNDGVPGLTLTTTTLVLKVSSLERDREALRNIYAATDGDNWTTAVVWLTNDDVTTWGNEVTVSNSRVTGVNLSGFGLVNALPDDINDISGLQTIDLSNNGLTGLPDLTSLTEVLSLDVSSNALDFGDLEPNVTITNIVYSNQAPFALQDEAVKVPKDGNYEIVLDIPGTANRYQWSASGPVISGAIDGATGATYTVAGIDYENMGAYTVNVTSDIVQNLILTSHPQTVNATTTIQFSPTYLDDAGNPVNLEEGNAQLLQVVPNAPFDSLENVGIAAGGFSFEEVVLGEYLIGIRADGLPDLLPTYFRSQFLWELADTLFLRDAIMEELIMQQQPRELTPDDGDGIVGLLVESDFPDDVNKDGSRIESRRKVKRAGCSLRRRRRAGGGRPENDDDEFELVVYKETDDDGRVTFINLPEGEYRLNIEYPGIPMDPNTFIEFEVGVGGIEDNELTLEATVTDDGIAVELVEELGFYRRYFKELEIYPNPASDVLNIRYKKLMSDKVRVQVLSLQGRVIHEEEVRKGFNQTMSLDVDLLESGIYLVRFYDPTSREPTLITYRVMINRE